MTSEERKPTANAEMLSLWAEQTQGLIDKDLYVVSEKGKLVLKEEPQYADTCIIRVHTSGTYSNRVWPKRPLVPSKTLELGDALFWSEGAAEKFVWPYYHSQRLYKEDVQHCHRVFKENSKIVALLHTYPSHMMSVKEELVPLGREPNTESGLIVLKWD